MDRSELILAALAPGGGHRYAPVQIQKLLFLIDRRIPDLVGGPHFQFTPYHYGPFDKRVYKVLEGLSGDGYVHIDEQSSRRTYVLTPEGIAAAENQFDRLDPEAREFISRTSEFVRKASFSQLVSAIYKAYPEMRANSVFQY